MYKFGKMKKKPVFVQKVKTIGYFTQPEVIVELHGKALDGRERESLIFPNRITDKTVRGPKDWKYQESHPDYFSKLVGREIDKFDP